MDRLEMDIELLSELYPDLEVGGDQRWVLIPEFPLPEGWNRQSTRVLILIPPGYPETPPDNFYVPIGLRLADGRMPGGYTEAAEHIGERWGQFSWHVDVSTWSPSADPHYGHSLKTYVAMVAGRLAENS